MENLKPCPFCGSEAESYETTTGSLVECSNFDCHVGTLNNDWTKKKVISIWNTRTSGWISVDDALPEALTSVLVNISNDRVKNDVSEAYHRQNGAFVPQYELGKNGLKAGDCEGVTHWMPLPQPPSLKELV